MSVSRSVIKKVLAVETPEGDGALVRRSIGSMGLKNLTPFLMLDHFHVSKGARLEGFNGCVRAKGSFTPKCPFIRKALQILVAFSFGSICQNNSKWSIPTAYPDGLNGPVKVKVISGSSHGVESPVRPLGGCWFFHVIFDKKSTIFQDIRLYRAHESLYAHFDLQRIFIASSWTSFLYILKGSLTIGSETLPHQSFNTLVFSNSANETGVSISAAEDKTEVILVAGEPLDQTVFQYGPFVMTNREEIQKTLIDYQTGRNGFEKAHTWKSKIAHE
ncbi:hypothetical protein H0H87_000061 [Tephrocybe sp. NHM501043]|nr:hypothetical protein H0H87_000061 [Tephrocybe sp. NHM501043]